MPDPPEDRSATAPGGDGSSVRRESTRQSYAGADAGLKGHVEEQPFGKDSSNGSEQETSKPGAVPTQQQQQPKEPAKKDSKLKQMWEKAGLDA